MEAKHVARFESKVDRSGGPNACHPWTASTPKGYGRFKVDGRTKRAHVVALVLKLGRPIAPGMRALHTCVGNPACCNPDHLYEGTDADNVRDRVRQGRSARGDNNGARRRPDRLARGDRNGSRIHPNSRPRGLNHGRHTTSDRLKLDANKVQDMRQLADDGVTYAELGRRFGVNEQTARDACIRRTWAHVP